MPNYNDIHNTDKYWWNHFVRVLELLGHYTITKIAWKNAFSAPSHWNNIHFEYQGIIFNEKSPKTFTNAFGQADRRFPVFVFDPFPKPAKKTLRPSSQRFSFPTNKTSVEGQSQPPLPNEALWIVRGIVRSQLCECGRGYVMEEVMSQLRGRKRLYERKEVMAWFPRTDWLTNNC